MKKIPLIVTILIFALTACGPATNRPIVPDESPTAPQLDNIIIDESPAPPQNDTAPRPADTNLARGKVFLDSTELLTLESYPLQFTLVLKGSLPTPCHELRIALSSPDSQNKIVLDVYSVVDPNVICAQVLEPFEENFPLGSFPAGHYSLWVNGEQIAEFEA